MRKRSLECIALLLLLAFIVCPGLLAAAHPVQQGLLSATVQSRSCAAEEMIYSVAFSPDGNSVLASWDKGTARLWDAHTGALKYVFAHKARQSPWITQVMHVRFSPNGDYILTGAYWDAKLWSARTGQELHTFPRNREHNIPDYRGTKVYFSPDSQNVLAGGIDGATLWDVKTGQKLRRFQGYSERGSVALSPDGRHVLTSTEGLTPEQMKVQIWDTQTGKIVHEFVGALNGQFSPDGKSVFVPDPRGLSLWDLATYERLRILPIQGSWILSPSGRYLIETSILESERKQITALWDVQTSTRLQTIPYSGLGDVIFLPDENHLITTIFAQDRDLSLRLWYVLWDIEHSREINRFALENGDPATFAVSMANANLLMAVGEQLYLVHPITGRIIRQFC